MYNVYYGKIYFGVEMRMKNSLLLLLTAIIWGSSFVAQSVGMDYVGPFTFTCIRSILGGLVLIPFLLWSYKGNLKMKKTDMLGGISCGIALFAASNAQQIGLVYTTVGKGGFITSLYVVIVPVIGLLLGKKVRKMIWFCVGLSVVGLYLLCMTEGNLSLGYGDLLILVCAVLFSLHIMIIDYFSSKGDAVNMSCIQFFTCAALSGIVMLGFEQPSFANIMNAKYSILYAGVLSSGVAYTLQIVGQKGVNPTVASLILCLESVVSAISGWFILHEAMTSREVLGCVLMFAAIVLAQVPMPRWHQIFVKGREEQI